MKYKEQARIRDWNSGWQNLSRQRQAEDCKGASRRTEQAETSRRLKKEQAVALNRQRQKGD
jgi:hypothetical protein